MRWRPLTVRFYWGAPEDPALQVDGAVRSQLEALTAPSLLSDRLPVQACP